jgi:hypothetical protein
MQRVLEQHVGAGDLVDDGEIDFFSPKVREPAHDDGLVRFFSAHDGLLSMERESFAETTRRPPERKRLSVGTAILSSRTSFLRPG